MLLGHYRLTSWIYFSGPRTLEQISEVPPLSRRESKIHGLGYRYSPPTNPLRYRHQDELQIHEAHKKMLDPVQKTRIDGLNTLLKYFVFAITMKATSSDSGYGNNRKLDLLHREITVNAKGDIRCRLDPYSISATYLGSTYFICALYGYRCKPSGSLKKQAEWLTKVYKCPPDIANILLAGSSSPKAREKMNLSKAEARAAATVYEIFTFLSTFNPKIEAGA